MIASLKKNKFRIQAVNFVPLMAPIHGLQRENIALPFLYPLLRAQPSAKTARKTPLPSQSIGVLAAA
jgi:hypothetical protein